MVVRIEMYFSHSFSFLEKTAKGRWRSLRDYYRQELREHGAHRSGAGADEVGTSMWPYFSQMIFLKDILKTDARSSKFTLDETASVLREASKPTLVTKQSFQMQVIMMNLCHLLHGHRLYQIHPEILPLDH